VVAAVVLRFGQRGGKPKRRLRPPRQGIRFVDVDAQNLGSAGLVLVLAARSGRAAFREAAYLGVASPLGHTDRQALPAYGIIDQSSKARRGGAISRRDNQKLSPYIIQALRSDSIIGIAALDQLHEQELLRWVDTRGPECDRDVAGYVRVINGERERTIWQVAA